MRVIHSIRNIVRNWRRNEDGIATAEAGLIFPILLVLLVGTFDMGNAILAGQKNIRASQVTADLVTRGRTIDGTGLNEAIEGGKLALAPFDTQGYGVDIISVRFDDDAAAHIVWRETRNMQPIPDVLSRVEPLASPNEGVVVVATKYNFEPLFAGFVVDQIPMEEIAFARGRRSAVVNRE